LALSAAALAAEKGFLWDGTHWKDMSAELKVAYVKGIGNMADFETASGGAGRAFCISKAFVDELKTKTVGQVVAEVDKYYKETPARCRPRLSVDSAEVHQLCPRSASRRNETGLWRQSDPGLRPSAAPPRTRPSWDAPLAASILTASRLISAWQSG
jgi:hypothetical protein